MRSLEEKRRRTGEGEGSEERSDESAIMCNGNRQINHDIHVT